MESKVCDVLLINAPSAYKLPPNSRRDHIGIGYLAAVLRAQGISVHLLDTPMLDWGVRRTLGYLGSFTAKIVGISALQAQSEGAVGIAKGLRARGWDMPIVLGGQFPTFCYDRLLADFPEISAIIRGEGEVSFLELVQRMLGGKVWEDCPGAAFRKNGEIVANPLPPLVEDLDSLPFPARDTLPQVRSLGALVSVSSSRGCPARCSFCSIHNFYRLAKGPIWRARSTASVMEEIRKLVKDYEVREFNFVDDNFIGGGEKSKRRAREISEALIKENIGVSFSLSCRVSDVEEELFALLKRAGLSAVCIGIESGNQRQLDTYNKGVTVEDNKRALHILRKVGVEPGIGFIMGDPYLTPAELLENMKFLKEMGIKLSELSFPLGELWLFDGADILERLRAEGRVRGDYLRGYSYVAKHRGFQMIYRAAGKMRDLFHPPAKRTS